MSIKNDFIEQLMSQRSYKNKRTYIIKKPLLLFPLTTEEIQPTPKRSKQIRSRSEHPHRKNKTVPIKEGEIIQNYKKDVSESKNFKTQQKKTERGSSQKQKQSLPNQYKSSMLIRSSNTQPRRAMKDYLATIRGRPQQSYEILTNFDILRKRHRRQSLRITQRAIFEFIVNTYQSIYENLSEKEIDSKSILANCQKYFSCFQKVKIEVLFSIFYSNSLHPKIRPLLIYQRVILFLICLICTDGSAEKLARIQKQSLRLMVQLLVQSYITLFQPIRQQQDQVLSHINQTFRMLKAAGEVEKKWQIIQRQMRKMYYNGQNIQHQAYTEVEEDFKSLIQSKDDWPLELLTQKQMRLNWYILRIPPVPYLPIKSNDKKYTLVIELDHTLIFYDKETKILKYRPYLDLMLTKIFPYFEIVAFSKADQKYAQVLVGQIERNNKLFSYMLSQQHLSYSMDGRLIKDISKIGRQLSTIAIVDHHSSMYRKYSANGIQIQSWFGDKSDKQLQRVQNILLELVNSKANNIPQALAERNYLLKASK